MEESLGIDSKRPQQSLHPLLAAIVYAGLYYIGGILGDWAAFKPYDFSAFWPPSGLCLAALLLLRRRWWATAVNPQP